MSMPDQLRDLRIAPAYEPPLAPEMLRRYADMHGAIYTAALQQIRAWAPPGRPLRILELGAAPYCFTALLLQSLDCDVSCVSVPPQVWPGEMAGVEHGNVALRVGERTWEVPVALLNVERELLPFVDGTFDVVLCMDVLQNLGYHPTLMFCETQRVLRPQGKLLVTVPNGLSMRRLLWLLCGVVDSDPFAARGMYQRRQRCSTPQEVTELVAGCGFRLDRADLLNLERLPLAGRPRLLAWLARRLTSASRGPLRRRRDYLLLAATPIGRPQAAYPAGLYHYVRLYPRIPGAGYAGDER